MVPTCDNPVTALFSALVSCGIALAAAPTLLPAVASLANEFTIRFTEDDTSGIEARDWSDPVTAESLPASNEDVSTFASLPSELTSLVTFPEFALAEFIRCTAVEMLLICTADRAILAGSSLFSFWSELNAFSMPPCLPSIPLSACPTFCSEDASKFSCFCAWAALACTFICKRSIVSAMSHPRIKKGARETT